MIWNSDEKKKIIKNYQNQFEKFGVNPSSLFIPGRKQNARFNIIKEIGIKNNDSILDVGCGFGDLFAFLKKTVNYNGSYCGIDITPEFVEVCRKRYPNEDFKVLDILQDEITNIWDYVVLTGTLNIKIGEAHADFVKKMIAKMYAMSKKGVSIDFVSNYGDDRYEYLYRADPFEIFNFCKTFTKRVCLRYDYMPYEFAIYLYHDDSVTKDNIFTQYQFPEIIKY